MLSQGLASFSMVNTRSSAVSTAATASKTLSQQVQDQPQHVNPAYQRAKGHAQLQADSAGDKTKSMETRACQPLFLHGLLGLHIAPVLQSGPPSAAQKAPPRPRAMLRLGASFSGRDSRVYREQECNVSQSTASMPPSTSTTCRHPLLRRSKVSLLEGMQGSAAQAQQSGQAHGRAASLQAAAAQAQQSGQAQRRAASQSSAHLHVGPPRLQETCARCLAPSSVPAARQQTQLSACLAGRSTLPQHSTPPTQLLALLQCKQLYSVRATQMAYLPTGLRAAAATGSTSTA